MVTSTVPLVIVLAAVLPHLVCTHCALAEETLTIYVSIGGSENDSCWSGGLENPCGSIRLALKGIQVCSNFSKYEVIVEPGVHSLNSSVTLTQVHDVSISGRGNNNISNAAINCTVPNAGISFQDSNQLSISNLLISNCGALHYSMNRDLSDSVNPGARPFLNFTAAIYFENCTMVILDSVNITNSNGTGAAFYNTAGSVEMKYSTFMNNAVKENPETFVGGGGVIVYFSFCLPGNSSCRNDHPPVHEYNNNARYEIKNCTFNSNYATTGDYRASHHIYKPGDEGFNFGRGGGLAVFFKGTAKNNTLTIVNSSFTGNRAEIGAGMYFSFEDKSQCNKLTVLHTIFSNNTCYKQNVPPSDFSTGGGLAAYFLLNGTSTLKNQAKFESCSFNSNEAYQGGGVAFLSTAVYSEMAFQNRISFTACNFSRNRGRIGAAVNVFRWFEIPQGDSLNTAGYASALPFFHNCTFWKNGHGRYHYLDSPGRTNVSGSTFGAVYIESIATDFNGFTLFFENNGSAMVIQSANVRFPVDSFVNFTNNRGRIGAGIALLGDSHMTVYPETVMHFVSNYATERGGAIFAIQTEQHHTGYSHICFVSYYDIYTPPTEWTSRFYFEDNRDFEGSISLHVSSLLPCVWPHSTNSTIEHDIKRTPCGWKNWHFGNNSTCLDQIRTSPVYLKSECNTTKVYPGLPKRLQIEAFDELNHNVTNTTVFTVTSKESDLNVLFISDTSLQVYRRYCNDCEPSTVYLQTFDTITVSLRLMIEVLPCPPAWTYSEEKQACYCDRKRKFDGMINCDSSDNGSFVSSVRIGACIGYDNNMSKVIAAQCPFSAGYGHVENMEFNSLTLEDVRELNREFCKGFNRRGELCSKCAPGMGASPYSSSFNCARCHNGSKLTAWLVYFALEFGAETVVFILVFVLHIGLTTAPANGFVFFSQIMSMPLQILVIETGLSLFSDNLVSKYLSNLLIIPYSVVSLEFHYFEGADICLSENLTPLHILALQYTGAIYPILLSMLALLFVELHARGCRVVVCIGRPLCILTARFRQTWKPATSIIDAFATFTLLSYTRIVRVSFSLLSPSTVVDINNTAIKFVLRYDPSVEYFGSEHKFYAALSVFMLVLGTFPVIFLLFYPCKFVQRCLNRFKMNHHALQVFAEAFQGCYKNGSHNTPDRRFFAGVYFIIRLVVFTIYTVLQSHLENFYLCIITAYVLALFSIVVLQPYKNNFYNCLDASFFVLLLLNNVGMSAVYYMLVDTPSITKRSASILWYFVYISLFIPLLYMIAFLVYRLITSCKWCRICRRKIADKYLQTNSSETDPLLISNNPNSITHSSISNPNSPSTDMPDRLGRPERYNDMAWPTTGDGGYTLESSNEHTSVRRLRNVSHYGSAAVDNIEPDTY